jgi:hypothetical protein
MSQEIHKREIKYSGDSGQPWEEGVKADAQGVYQVTPKVKNSNNFGELLFGKSLNWYKEVAVWPMFILLVLEISLRVIQRKYFETAPEEIFSNLINLLRIVLFAYLAVSATRQFKARRTQTLTAAVLGGLAVGVILAVFQLFWYWELWTFFNLVGQPLLLAMEGLVISWLIIKLFFKNNP